jgi:hypothetical protein
LKAAAKNTTALIVKVEQVLRAYLDKAVPHKRVPNVLAQKVRIKVHTQKAPALETAKALHLAALDAANNE